MSKTTDKKRIAVIGLGATGAFAARAAWDMGYDVDVYVHGVPNTTPPGAFWLHWVPAELEMDGHSAEPINITGLGTAENYINLQWGMLSDVSNIKSSFPTKTVVEKGYSPTVFLSRLVPDPVEVIQLPYKLSDTDVGDLSIKYHKVFQTFPTKHSMVTHAPLIPYVAAARWNYKPFAQAANVVVYNGTGEGLVVREAQLFGNHFLEFPKNTGLAQVQASRDLSDYQHVILRDLHPNTEPIVQTGEEKIYMIGRFAQWNRHALSHHAYEDVQKVLEIDG